MEDSKPGRASDVPGRVAFERWCDDAKRGLAPAAGFPETWDELSERDRVAWGLVERGCEFVAQHDLAGPIRSGLETGAPPQAAQPRWARRVDGASIWSSLDGPERTDIGAACVELMVARVGLEVASTVTAEELYMAAERAIDERLAELAESVLLGRARIDPDREPPLPSLLGRVCAHCGRTDHDVTFVIPDEWPEPDACHYCVAEQPIRKSRTTEEKTHD